MQTVLTATQLVEAIKDLPVHTIGSVTTKKKENTTKKDRDTGLPFNGTIVSETTYNPFIGLTYQTTVNNRRIKEGKNADFQAQSLPWGEWYGEGHTVIRNKGENYLRLTLCGANKTKKQYFLDGVPVQKSDLPNVLPKKKASSSTQGLQDEVIVVAVKIPTIQRIKINGEDISVCSD